MDFGLKCVSWLFQGNFGEIATTLYTIQSPLTLDDIMIYSEMKMNLCIFSVFSFYIKNV